MLEQWQKMPRASAKTPNFLAWPTYTVCQACATLQRSRRLFVSLIFSDASALAPGCRSLWRKRKVKDLRAHWNLEMPPCIHTHIHVSSFAKTTRSEDAVEVPDLLAFGVILIGDSLITRNRRSYVGPCDKLAFFHVPFDGICPLHFLGYRLPPSSTHSIDYMQVYEKGK